MCVFKQREFFTKFIFVSRCNGFMPLPQLLHLPLVQEFRKDFPSCIHISSIRAVSFGKFHGRCVQRIIAINQILVRALQLLVGLREIVVRSVKEIVLDNLPPSLRVHATQVAADVFVVCHFSPLLLYPITHEWRQAPYWLAPCGSRWGQWRQMEPDGTTSFVSH